jgi:Ca-activated chloride channel family protein
MSADHRIAVTAVPRAHAGKTRSGSALAIVLVVVILIVLIIAAFGALIGKAVIGPEPTATITTTTATAAAADTPPVPAGTEAVSFLYSGDIREWVEAVTADYNKSPHETRDGKPYVIQAVALGSGEMMDDIISGRRKPDAVSPDSAAFLALLNARWRTTSGRDLVGNADDLVVSPLVIAMWKPLAEALGWPGKAVGWSDISALAHDPAGWGSRGHPQWGPFRFCHTGCAVSDSGLAALLATIDAAAGKSAGLTVADVNAAKTGDFLENIEGSVVHYGSSTAFVGQRMFAHGPGFLSAAVLDESQVIGSYRQSPAPILPVVAIYPQEGTFLADHPAGLVDAPWVTPAHAAAAKDYLQFLREKPQQERALACGFRPGSSVVALGAPIDADHGVDPKQPQTTLEIPPVAVMDAALALWKQRKKKADVTLVIDTSGSMSDNNKIGFAREGANVLLAALGDADHFSLYPFSTTGQWAEHDVALADQRAKVISSIGGLYADGDTALYDAIDLAWQDLHDRDGTGAGAGKRIAAVVVLTDGEDTDSRLNLETLLQHIGGDREHDPVRIFTIAYGADAGQEPLKKIAEATNGRFYVGTTANIPAVFQDISTFF